MYAIGPEASSGKGEAVTAKHHSPDSDRAVVTGLQALSWLAVDHDLFGAFLDQAGADAADVRARATDPAFLGFVLDFVMQDDGRVVDFARAQGMAPEGVMAARRALPGGDAPEWT